MPDGLHRVLRYQACFLNAMEAMEAEERNRELMTTVTADMASTAGLDNNVPPQIPPDAQPPAAPAPAPRADSYTAQPGLEARDFPPAEGMSREEAIAALEEERLLHQRRKQSLRDMAVRKYKATDRMCESGFTGFMQRAGLAWENGGSHRYHGRSRVPAPSAQPEIVVPSEIPFDILWLSDEGIRAMLVQQREKLARELDAIRAEIIRVSRDSWIRPAIRDRILAGHGMKLLESVRVVALTVSFEADMPHDREYKAARYQDRVAEAIRAMPLPGQAGEARIQVISSSHVIER